ncbi:MAG: hypothetical protein QXN71_02385 [Candidatus Aenigmatarchaeota archaeon]
MRKAAIPALVVIIFIAFGIILVAVVISWALNKFIEITQGKCWADADKTADSIKSSLAKAKNSNDEKSQEVLKITAGDCVGGIIMFNKDDDKGLGFSEVINDRCANSDTVKAYILVIPYKTLAEEARKDKGFFSKFSEWIKHPYLSFKQVWEEGRQYIVRIKPICKTLDVPFDNTVGSNYPYCIPKGICNPNDLSQLKMDILKNEKAFEYCYKPLKVDSPVSENNKAGYVYRIVEYPCAK